MLSKSPPGARALLWTVGPALLCLLALPSRAETPSRFEAELAIGVSGSAELRSVIVTAPLFELSAPFSDDAAFVAQWGLTIATGDPARDAFAPTYIAPGNPLFGFALRLGEGLVITPSVALPVARMPQTARKRPAATFAFAGALGLRGGLDRWLWLPDRLSVVVPVTWARWFDPLLVEVHVKFGFLLPMVEEPLDAVVGNGRSNDGADAFVLQSQLRVAARLARGVWFATRFSMVYVPTSEGDNFELALGPELRLGLGPWSHLELGATLNLGSPLGPSWEAGRFWAVILGGSTSL